MEENVIFDINKALNDLAARVAMTGDISVNVRCYADHMTIDISPYTDEKSGDEEEC